MISFSVPHVVHNKLMVSLSNFFLSYYYVSLHTLIIETLLSFRKARYTHRSNNHSRHYICDFMWIWVIISLLWSHISLNCQRTFRSILRGCPAQWSTSQWSTWLFCRYQGSKIIFFSRLFPTTVSVNFLKGKDSFFWLYFERGAPYA